MTRVFLTAATLVAFISTALFVCAAPHTLSTHEDKKTGTDGDRVNSSMVHVDSLHGSDDPTVSDGSAAHPFRTVAGWQRADNARDATHARTVSGIDFGPGIHFLTDTLRITTSPFEISGNGQSTTLLSGGIEVKGFVEAPWPPTGGRAWTATMPPNTSYFRQVIVSTSTTEHTPPRQRASYRKCSI